MQDAFALLSLCLEWGVDVALDEEPKDRFAVLPAVQQAPVAHSVARSAPRPAPSAPPAPADGGARTIAAACADLDALDGAIRNFDGCALRTTATHTLLAQRATDHWRATAGRVVIVSEVPEADEDRSGEVMAGPSGTLLARMLGSIALTREDVVVAPVLPWRPPGGRPASEAELQSCLPFVLRAITLLAPRRLVLMGNTPARLLLGTEAPMARLRGRWHSFAVEGLASAVPAMAMRHPAQLAASPVARRESWDDLLMLREDIDRAFEDIRHIEQKSP
jgi:uracil-DNA glycosylase